MIAYTAICSSCDKPLVDDDVATGDPALCESCDRSLYFAFGMNMAPSTMNGAEPVGGAYLVGWKLAWRSFADIEPGGPGDMVPGVLWNLTGWELGMLDSREGYRGPGRANLYDRRQVEVELSNGGGRVHAWVYVMQDQRRPSNPASISPGYLDLLHEGRQAFDLPTDDLPEGRW